MIAAFWAAGGTHHAGSGGASLVEWFVVAAATVVLLWSLAAAIRYTVRPGETDPAHIKRRILADEFDRYAEGRDP